MSSEIIKLFKFLKINHDNVYEQNHKIYNNLNKYYQINYIEKLNIELYNNTTIHKK